MQNAGKDLAGTSKRRKDDMAGNVKRYGGNWYKIWRAGAEKGYGGNSIQKIWRERKKILDFRQTDVMCFLWREILAY